LIAKAFVAIFFSCFRGCICRLQTCRTGHWTSAADSGSFIVVKKHLDRFARAVFILTMGVLSTSLAGQNQSGSDRLILSGDLVYFFGPGKPGNCTMSNQYKRGEPVGFRMTAINPTTGKRDRASQLVVHLTFAGKVIDIPMRDRQTEQQPERDFFVAKWIVPDDAPTGVVRYTVTAKDSQGRTGEWKPFDVLASQLTVVQ